MNYKLNCLVVVLRSGKSMNIGVMVLMIEWSIFVLIIWGIEDEVVKSGYGIIMC